MRRILYLDDEPALRRVFPRLVSSSGFEVDVAADKEEAKNLLASHQYSLLVFDQILGEGQLGADLLAEVAPGQPNAGLIMVSALIAENDRLEIDSRPVHLVAKPWTREVLLAAFEHAVRRDV